MKRLSGKTYPNPQKTSWEEALSTPDFSKDDIQDSPRYLKHTYSSKYWLCEIIPSYLLKD